MTTSSSINVKACAQESRDLGIRLDQQMPTNVWFATLLRMMFELTIYQDASQWSGSRHVFGNHGEAPLSQEFYWI
jgi:hypothetical protein